jgi:hypothetical protein
MAMRGVERVGNLFSQKLRSARQPPRRPVQRDLRVRQPRKSVLYGEHLQPVGHHVLRHDAYPKSGMNGCKQSLAAEAGVDNSPIAFCSLQRFKRAFAEDVGRAGEG